MSLTDISDVSFYGGFNIDKVVRVYEGSYNLGTATTTRGGGFYSTLKQYQIKHDFTRPVFTQLFYSVNGGAWFPAGSFIDFGAISVSDSSNIYILSADIMGMYPTATLSYKIVCTWITDYDGSNPLVTDYQYTDNPIAFDGRLNYQKIKQEGETTYPPGTFDSQITIPIYHNLGYKPNAKAWFEPIAGEVWPMNFGGQSNVFLYSATQDEMSILILDNSIQMTVYRYSNATRKLWYKIYYDTN